LLHCESASSWFKWLFRVSPIFVCEGCGNHNWLTAFSPGVVVHAATSAAFLLFSFVNHIVFDSVLCFFPISMFVLRNSIVSISCRGISRGFPSGWSLSSFIVQSPFFIFGMILQRLSGSSRFRLGGGACGVVRDFVNFPLSRSSSSCLPTFLKISIYSSSVVNAKWDRQRNISCRSFLSTRTLHAIPESPALMLRFSRRRR